MSRRKSERTGTSRLALIGLLTWFSCHHQHYNSNLLVVEAATGWERRSNGPSIQHRVKRSRRLVDYGVSRRTGATHARTNTRETDALVGGAKIRTRNDARRNLRREVHPGEDTIWVFDASRNDDPTIANQHLEYDDNNNNGDDRRRRSLLRYLYDQFVGEELPPSGVYNSATNDFFGSSGTTNNVTAEVEFENIVESNQTFFRDGNYTQTIINNNGTTTTTTVVGNSTNMTGHTTESVVYTKGNNATDAGGNTTMEQQDDLEPQFQPLRMRAILAEDSGNGGLLNDTEREILFYEMLSPALLAWSSSLRVDPVVGNLTVDVDQLLDGETCGPGIDSGLPSIRVPLQHITEGIPETDMIVYLSLGFSIPNEDVDETMANNETDSNYDTDSNWTSDNEAGDDEKYEVNQSNFMHSKRDGTRERLFGDTDRPSPTEPGGQRRRLITETNSGTFRDLPPSSISSLQSSNATSNATSSINICTGDYLAAASYCSTDQYDRPTAALLHICIDDNFFDPKHLRRNIMTLIHELGHALGFNALSMAHFRRPDGTPYTPRDEDGNVPDSTVECTGPDAEHQIATLPLPSEEILSFRNVRGGVRVAEIVTPSVVQVVRNQFDCQLLTGAELESSEGSPLSLTVEGSGCIGDHWERRLFSSDVMNPIVDDIEYSTRISTLTLAYFADSGWYQVDLSNADVASGWGRGAGCNFVNDTCINEFGDVPPQNAPFFCNEVSDDGIPGLSLPQNIHGCTPDLSRKAKCSIGQYDLDLPEAYQYFNSTYGSDVGGSDTLMDFCPVYDGYDNGLCSSSESETVIRANEVERFGLRNSRCLVGNVFPFYRNTALCLPIACVLEDRSLRVKVRGDWHICDSADEIIQSGSVNITCPDPRRICPTFFCPYDCLGTGGECDYKTGKCLCQYENVTHPEETVLDVCGIVEEIVESENRTSTKKTAATTLRPILQRKGKIDSMMPPSDTKISDYYVSDVLHLDDRPRFIDAWGILILSFTVFILVSSFVVLFLFRDPLKRLSSDTCDRLMFWTRKLWDTGADDDDEDGIGRRDGNIDGRTREKHKMVASVLVDMRIRQSDTTTNNNSSNNITSNWMLRRGRRRRDRRDINESLAETDGRMTDSEIASSAAPAMSDSLSEVSSRQMVDETMSDLEGEVHGIHSSNNDDDELRAFENHVDLLAAPPSPSPPQQQQPPVMRRRRFVPKLFS